jgi:hypothetical protein
MLPGQEVGQVSDSQRLAAVRTLHTAIYLVMVASIAALLYAGVTGQVGAWLWTALALLAVESVVFVGNGRRCPLTSLAVRYGARTGHVFDTFLPERVTRHTFVFFGSLMVIGLLMLGLRWAGAIG